MTLPWEKYNYETIGSQKSIVDFRSILGEIAERCDLINTMYIDASIAMSGGSYVEMAQLTISEQNFFSSDTDEPWTLKEVLEEICQYLGYTAVQYKDSLYLYDMQSHASKTWQSDSDVSMIMTCFKYQKSSSWASYSFGSYSDLAEGISLSQSHFMGTGSDISLETIYNKVQVKDSFYEIDHFIPDFFDDASLTNRNGDFWNCDQISRSGHFKYINKKGKSKEEEKNENEHIYYIRRFTHNDYDSIYRNTSTLAEVTPGYTIKVTDSDFSQNTNLETATGTYSVSATFKNTDNTSHTVYVYAELRYDWYDGYYQMSDYNYGYDSDSFTLESGESIDVQLRCSSSYDSAYTATATYGTTYTIDGESTYDLNYSSGDDTAKYIGATVVDLATFDKPMSTTKYNYETESNIDFKRYIMIHQADKPDMMHPYATWLFTTDITPLADSEIEAVFPSVMELNDYVNPMIIDDNAYLALNTEAIFERYNVQYINPDWTDENSSLGGLGLFNKTSRTTSVAPALIFKLRIGDKYWSSSANAWTTTDSCFVVPLGVDKTDDDDVDFTGWWNESHAALNNISWTDWAGVSGYKIPLDTSLDFSSDIEFDIMMPSKMQDVSTDYDYSGMNNYCWISDLNIDFATKMSENYDNADIIYENIIDSGSVNTLSDISCKITSYPGMGMHSYSNVALDGVLLTGIKKYGLDDNYDYPEKNIIKAYTNQYHTPTIKQTMTLVDTISPFSRIKDPVLDKYFGILGQEIDYAKGRQTMTLIETKEWDTSLDD